MPTKTLSSPGASSAGAPPAATRRAPGDHWKKLLRAKKPAEPVGVDAFVAELNRRLRADGGFFGCRFVTAAASGRATGGFTWEGPEAMKPAIFRIVQAAMGEFEVDQPFFSDR